ncbi:cyclin-D4-1-like [Vitis riparia]|uniref:cyclin-D4-1-like n=1 Tax=Vitis riparia TaxID=96939 RepID=UPI00155AEBEE|nr:cyclin-D4-1-like [Vitis riparia]
MVLPEGVRARQDAVNGMLKVHSYNNFRPETAYLSVTHLDRFLYTYDLPGKEWSLQLLSVPCIALAVKMEGMSAPLPLDLQVMEPRFLFTAMTGQQMELLPRFFSQFYSSSNVSDLILASCRVTDQLNFLSSSIAAASLLWVTSKNVDDQILEHFHLMDILHGSEYVPT